MIYAQFLFEQASVNSNSNQEEVCVRFDHEVGQGEVGLVIKVLALVVVVV